MNHVAFFFNLLWILENPALREHALKRDAQRLHLEAQRSAGNAEQPGGPALVPPRAGKRRLDGPAFRLVVQRAQADPAGPFRALPALRAALRRSGR